MSEPAAGPAEEATDRVAEPAAEPAAGTSLVARGAGERDPSLNYFLARLALFEGRVRIAVQRRRAADADPGDRFRGLYISEAKVDELLAASSPDGSALADVDALVAPEAAAIEAHADEIEAAGVDLRLRRLVRAFGLDATDVELLLVAIAPDLDVRFERLYGYLHDDVSRRRASIGLALELAGQDPFLASARSRLGPSGPLVAGGLVIVEDGERPVLTRSLRVPDRVAAHVLGDDAVEPAIEPLLADEPPVRADPASPLATALRHGVELAYIREPIGSAAASMCTGALASLGRSYLALDLNRVDAASDAVAVATLAVREARLRDAALVAGPLDLLSERNPAAVRVLAEARCTVILYGTRTWDAAWSTNVAAAARRGHADRRRAACLLGIGAGGGSLGRRRKPAQRIGRPARHDGLPPDAGAGLPRGQGRPKAGPGSRSGGQPGRPAGGRACPECRRPRPPGSAHQAPCEWDDLVLPSDIVAQLRELTARARHRAWSSTTGASAGAPSSGRGVTALFAGDSGTGKTMSAEVVARDLGLDLYVIDLSTVVDKYIGETEKNLDRVFREADRVNGVLLFDEADALFGKRSEVKDAHDRYANVEVAYLLQRMESFDGLAILTTNLRANIDEAFTRRLDVDRRLPDARRATTGASSGERHLAATLPQADDIDLDFLASAFKLSGGNIRNVA